MSDGDISEEGSPFSPAVSESEVSAGTGVKQEFDSMDESFSRGRLTDDESYCPSNPPKAPRLELSVKKEEAEPTFATAQTVSSAMKKVRSDGRGGVGGMKSPPLHPKQPKIQPAEEVILELADLAEQIDKHRETMEEDDDWPPRREGEESMARWWGPSSLPPVSIKEERYRGHWRENMCPGCYFMTGHDDKCDFQAKRGRWECLNSITPQNGRISTSPSVSFDDGGGNTPEIRPCATLSAA